MKSQGRKPANEDKAKVKPGIKTSPKVTHPILQLQQLVGNKAVTRMIQRHSQQDMEEYNFWTATKSDHVTTWLNSTGSGPPAPGG